MRRAVCIIAFLFLASAVTRADEYRLRKLFTSANGRFETHLKDHKWSLVEKPLGRELYRFSDYRDRAIWFHTMTLVVSDDGKDVVAVDDYSGQDFRKNPEVLFFFREGKIVKTYRLLDLTNPNFLQVSVSHFRWMAYGVNDFGIKDSEFSMSTLDLYDYLFDSTTGALIAKQKAKLLSETAVYVYGEVSGLGGTRHKIVVDCVIHGNAREGDTIFFDSKNRRWEGSGFDESLIIDRGQLLSVKGFLFNVCHGETWR